MELLCRTRPYLSFFKFCLRHQCYNFKELWYIVGILCYIVGTKWKLRAYSCSSVVLSPACEACLSQDKTLLFQVNVNLEISDKSCKPSDRKCICHPQTISLETPSLALHSRSQVSGESMILLWKLLVYLLGKGSMRHLMGGYREVITSNCSLSSSLCIPFWWTKEHLDISKGKPFW